MTTELEKRFEDFSHEVKVLFTIKNLDPGNFSPYIGDYRYYEKCKDALSYVCGWDASDENYNQGEFDSAMEYLIGVLQV